jgi:hypothetical protein
MKSLATLALSVSLLDILPTRLVTIYKLSQTDRTIVRKYLPPTEIIIVNKINDQKQVTA